MLIKCLFKCFLVTWVSTKYPNIVAIQPKNQIKLKIRQTKLLKLIFYNSFSSTLREHALNSPLYNVSNLSHPSTPMSSGGCGLLNHSNHQSNNLNSSTSGANLSGGSNSSQLLSGDGPPTPTQEMDLVLPDHRKSKSKCCSEWDRELILSVFFSSGRYEHDHDKCREQSAGSDDLVPKWPISRTESDAQFSEVLPCRFDIPCDGMAVGNTGKDGK